MNDIKLFLNNVVSEAIAPRIENGDFVADDGLETAVIISLFTDARVSVEQLPPGEVNQKGWWGDKVSDVDQDKIGSRLWTLSRAKRTTQTLRQYEDYSKEALEWMKEDGVAATINAAAYYDVVTKFLMMNLEIVRPKETTKYKVNWDKQLLIRS